MKNFKQKKNLWILLYLTILLSLVSINIANAQYIPLAPLPGIDGQSITLGGYVSAAFKIGIGLAGVFAVLMIVISGVQFIGGAASPSARTEATGRITNALFGLIIALGAWLLLNTINPDLTDTNIKFPVTQVQQVNINSPQSSTETQYCYSQKIGRQGGSRKVCGSSCPAGETCSTQQLEITNEYCYSKKVGRQKATRTVCEDSCPTGETCTKKSSTQTLSNTTITPGGSCGNEGGKCVEGSVFCPGSLSRDYGGANCQSGYVCCKSK